MSTRTIAFTKALKASGRFLNLRHYTIASYASTETFTQRLVIVDPAVTEPTWLMRPGTSKVVRRNVIALLLPTLDALTLDLAQTMTGVVTDYIGVRAVDQFKPLHDALLDHPSTRPLLATKVRPTGPVLAAAA